MDAPVKKPRPERDATDESLLAERKNLDQAIGGLAAEGSDADADEVVEVARQRADTVLERAREDADNGSPASSPGEVASQRKVEDKVLAAERAAADELLSREREEQARVLAALLPLEREKTDRHLLSERTRSDDSLAHRDDFMAIIGHDMRNLLGGIVLDATIVEQRASDSEEGKQSAAAMKRILRHAARMNRLIGDLLDVVSIEAGNLAIEKAAGDAAALLADAADIFANAAAEKGVVLAVAPVAGPLVAAFDHDRMLQVLANLVSNALKFTPRGGHVLLGGERHGAVVRLDVRDDGAGIPASLHEAAFERFRQVHDHDRRGLGLGLYIARSLVEAHGGRIWVESAPGAGSTFHVELPA